MTIKTLTYDEIRDREKQITEDARALGKEAIKLIHADRRTRYKEYVSQIELTPFMEQWLASMKKRFGNKVISHNQVVGWIVALLIVRYGEAEYHWPREVPTGVVPPLFDAKLQVYYNQEGIFTPEDVQRAEELRRGRLPDYMEIIEADEDD